MEFPEVISGKHSTFVFQNGEIASCWRPFWQNRDQWFMICCWFLFIFFFGFQGSAQITPKKKNKEEDHKNVVISKDTFLLTFGSNAPAKSMQANKTKTVSIHGLDKTFFASWREVIFLPPLNVFQHFRDKAPHGDHGENQPPKKVKKRILP